MKFLEVYAIGWGLTAMWIFVKLLLDEEAMSTLREKSEQSRADPSLAHISESTIAALAFFFLIIAASAIGSVWPVYWGAKFATVFPSSTGSSKPDDKEK